MEVLQTTEFQCFECGNQCKAIKFVDTDGEHRVNVEHDKPHCPSYSALRMGTGNPDRIRATGFMMDAVKERQRIAREALES